MRKSSFLLIVPVTQGKQPLNQYIQTNINDTSSCHINRSNGAFYTSGFELHDVSNEIQIPESMHEYFEVFQ